MLEKNAGTCGSKHLLFMRETPINIPKKKPGSMPKITSHRISNPKPQKSFLFHQDPHIKDELRIGDVNANLSKV